MSGVALLVYSPEVLEYGHGTPKDHRAAARDLRIRGR
jgi:hypothetical protein